MLQFVRVMVLAWPILAASGCQRPADSPVTASSPHKTNDANGSLSSLQHASRKDASGGDGSGGAREGGSNVTPGFIRPFPVVMYDRANQEVLAPYAERVAKVIGANIVQAAPENPVCCVWIELSRWLQNPGSPGYVMINQAGGSIIQASSEEQLRLAIEAFESVVERKGDFVEVPSGLVTNYEVRARAKNTEPGVGADSR